jgi:DNA-binding transcriptional LysR family regulator
MVGKGIDVAVRSGPLSDSSLVTHKLGAVPYWLCASPKYLATHGTPTLPDDLDRHHCLTILSESLSEIMPWTMRRGKDLMEVKPEYHLRMNDFLLVK